MPESHKAEKRRVQKANREAGIGDAAGRIVRVKVSCIARTLQHVYHHHMKNLRLPLLNVAISVSDRPCAVKQDAPTMVKCTVCGIELRVTKSNTELKAHSEGKHSSTMDACFPEAAAHAAAAAAAAAVPSSGSGSAKAAAKPKKDNDLSALLSAGLTGGKAPAKAARK
jgi:Zinc-binding